MRWLKLVGVGVYAAYLVHIGLLMLILPWSAPWASLLLRLPSGLAMVLDAPLARGLISGLGALHLVLVSAELLLPDAVKRSL